VGAAIAVAREWFEPRGRTLTVELPEREAPVLGDSARLTQVVVHLLSNAATFTALGGHVMVRVAIRDAEVRLVVEDDGPGIEPDVLPRIFDPLVRENVATEGERPSLGLGLGLAMVKRLVVLHYGLVTASSPGRGRGSRFVVRLPRYERLVTGPQRAADTEATPGYPPRGHGRGDTEQIAIAPTTEVEAAAPATMPDDHPRILVCDDDPDGAALLALVLRQRGYEAETAGTGSAALARAEALAPSLVLLDLGLPDIHGCEVARRLRQLPATRDAVIVAVTGSDDRQTRGMALAAGCDRHVVKPLFGEDLDEVLRLRRTPTLE
jgi:CheY-like chemotaxis protein